MREAFIVDGLRTPIGKRGGSLKGIHAVDLLGLVIENIVNRNSIDPSCVDDVIAGCVSQLGEQTGNVGRNAALAAGLPETVPGTTVDRQCGSSQQALHFAAQGIIAGSYEVAIACGVEMMSRVPMGSTFSYEGPEGASTAFGPKMYDRYPGLVPQGISAEMMAEKWNLDRNELDEISYSSHQRALNAWENGYFKKQILEVPEALHLSLIHI